jgi:hypothetical protein
MTKCLRVLAAVGIITIAPALTACAYAQYGNPRGYGRPGSPAYDNGYREGVQAGEKDARRNGRPKGFEDDNDYRRADKGWHREYGDREAYRYEFRRGYERGYRDAYSANGAYGGYGRQDGRRGGYGYPQYPGNGYPQYPNGSYGGRYPRGGYGYRSPAAQYGYDEGYQKGRDDARDGDQYDPVRQKWYREGDRHYDDRYGSRDQWKNEYRDAFRRGYDEGYRTGRF